MHLRLLASGLVFSLALAGCKTVPVEGDYTFADHPGKALVVLSTRMTAGTPCPTISVTGQVGFRKVEERGGPSVVFRMQVPRPARKVSTFSDMAGDEEATVAADPPTLFAVQEVDAGSYVLNSLVVFASPPEATYNAQEFPPLAFTAKEGEAVYLGELGVQMRGGDCKLLWPGLSGHFTFRVRDEWQRDEVPFKATIHNISSAAVQKRLIQVP